MAAERDRVALVAFVATSVLAGGNTVGVRFSNRELAPLWGAGLRFSLAALVLLGVMAVRRLPFPRGKALGRGPPVRSDQLRSPLSTRLHSCQPW